MLHSPRASDSPSGILPALHQSQNAYPRVCQDDNGGCMYSEDAHQHQGFPLSFRPTYRSKAHAPSCCVIDNGIDYVPGRLSMAESNTFSTKISNNITPLGTYRYTCHHLSKTSFGLRQNVRSSGHEHSSAGRLWEEFTYRIERLTQVFCRAFVWTIYSYQRMPLGTGIL